MRATAKEAISGFLCALMLALCIVGHAAVAGGCGFAAGLAKSHDGLKAMSKAAEPKLKAACVARADQCIANGKLSAKDCPPVLKCLKWSNGYAEAAKAVHRGLGTCNRIYQEAEAEGVFK